MRFTASFRDSDLVRFEYETDRRQGATIERSSSNREAGMHLLRSPANPRDKILSSLALTWRDSLPPPVRPTQLCECYPRVANRLALCWGDAVLTERLFKDLLNDRRGMQLRKGFPPLVQRELLALHRVSRGQAMPLA
jgi:hypothetical protein